MCLYLSLTPVQLMRPGIGLGDYVQHLGLPFFQGDWGIVVHEYTLTKINTELSIPNCFHRKEKFVQWVKGDGRWALEPG